MNAGILEFTSTEPLSSRLVADPAPTNTVEAHTKNILTLAFARQIKHQECWEDALYFAWCDYSETLTEREETRASHAYKILEAFLRVQHTQIGRLLTHQFMKHQ